MSRTSKLFVSVVIITLYVFVLSVKAQHSISIPAGPVYSYSHISTLTSTTVKAAAGVLHSVLVNGSGSSPCLVILYDSTNTSGNQVAAIDCASARQFNYDVAFTNGLTVVNVSTANAAIAADVTVTFQ
jgi:hypothetical protein